MAITRIHLAAATAAGFAAIILVGTVIRFTFWDDALVLSFKFAQPLTWLMGLTGVIVAWGLLKHYRWAWWLGMAAAAYELYRVGSVLVEHASFSRPPAMWPLLIAVLMLTFLVLAFPSHVRASCSR